MMSPRSASLTRCLAMALLLGASLPALAQAPEAPPAAEPLTLDQAMAHPDWIGPPVDAAWWSLDGQRAYYALKRAGSPVRDLWTVPVAGGAAGGRGWLAAGRPGVLLRARRRGPAGARRVAGAGGRRRPGEPGGRCPGRCLLPGRAIQPDPPLRGVRAQWRRLPAPARRQPAAAQPQRRGRGRAALRRRRPCGAVARRP